MYFFLFVAGSVCFQQCGDKEDHRMEIWWCLIALNSLCCFILFGMCVLLLDDCLASELPNEVCSVEIS
jgi:hypothetical protein